MGLALAAAAEAPAHGDVPIGAVLARGGEPLATGANERELRRDPTAHAEILVLRAGARLLGGWRLPDTTLYVTLEPCAMCAGAMVQARIDRLVFGASDPKAGAVGSLYDLARDSRHNHRVDVTSGVLGSECGTVLKDFFKALRSKKGETTE